MKKGLPKYTAISKELIQKIESGEFLPGDKIPSENDLIKMYAISNTTARKSLLELELQGWANRIKGKGTFVLNRSEDKHLTRVLGSFNAMKESFNNNLLREGFTPKNILLEKTVFENGISSNINNRHYIIEGPVLKIHRLRYGNDILLKDETRYISMSICPKINRLDLDQPLISIYEEARSFFPEMRIPILRMRSRLPYFFWMEPFFATTEKSLKLRSRFTEVTNTNSPLRPNPSFLSGKNRSDRGWTKAYHKLFRIILFLRELIHRHDRYIEYFPVQLLHLCNCLFNMICQSGS